MPATGRWMLGPLVALLAIADPYGHRAPISVTSFLAGRTRECPRCDLAGADFKRRELSGADLSGANLKDANLHDARLAGARLAGADLSGANLTARPI